MLFFKKKEKEVEVPVCHTCKHLYKGYGKTIPTIEFSYLSKDEEGVRHFCPQHIPGYERIVIGRLGEERYYSEFQVDKDGKIIK